MLIKPIIIKDGLPTSPADHTFTPASSQKGKEPATWYERTNGTPLGYRRITMHVDMKPQGTSVVNIVIADPVLVDLPNGCCVDKNTPQVAYTDFANLVFKMPARSTNQNRRDILAYARNVLGVDIVVAAVQDLEPAY